MIHRPAAMLAASLLLSLVNFQPAAAATIYDNVPFPATPGVTSMLGADQMFGNEAADNFVLSAGQTTIGEIHFWGGYYRSQPAGEVDNFTIRIYNNASTPWEIFDNQPGTVAAEVEILSIDRSPTAQVMPFPDLEDQPMAIYKYTAAIAPLTLAADTPYWLAISNDSGMLDWGWLVRVGALWQYDAHQWTPWGDFWGSFQGDPEDPFSVSGATVFYLTDVIHDVPEPSAVVLGAMGAVVLLGFPRLLRRR